MSEIKSKCPRGQVFMSKLGAATRFVYRRPKNANDLKREGRFMDVVDVVGKRRIRLNGKQINTMVKLLRSAGEIS